MRQTAALSLKRANDHREQAVPRRALKQCRETGFGNLLVPSTSFLSAFFSLLTGFPVLPVSFFFLSLVLFLYLFLFILFYPFSFLVLYFVFKKMF